LAYYLAHVDDVTDECILWPYGADGPGYGRLKINGRQESVHILACERHHGPRPVGMFALHAPVICHNPSCFNARGGHVSWGTPAENMQDRLLDGTGGTGEGCYNARLTWADVTEMRRRYAAGGILQRELAAEYGVSPSNVHHIIAGKRWKVA
jgi:hypothetical protein